MIALNNTHRLLETLSGIDGVQRIATAVALIPRQELLVVFGGEFNAGKSMLLNALLGRHLLKSSATPTTSQLTCVRFGDREHLRVANGSSKVIEYGIDCLHKLTTVSQDEATPQHQRQVTVFCKTDFLKPHLILVDTPGSSDAAPQTRIALNALRSADIIIWVLRATEVLKESERRLAEQWMSDNPGAFVVPVLNFMNFVGDDTRAAVRRRLSALLETILGPRLKWIEQLGGRQFFEINVQRALDCTVANSGEPEADFLALAAWLLSLRGQNSEIVKIRSRAMRVQRRVQLVQTTVRKRLATLKAEAVSIRHAKDDLIHQRHLEECRLKNQLEAHLALLERTSKDMLSAGLKKLYCSLQNEPISRLQRHHISWCDAKLQEAIIPVRESTNDVCKTLIQEFPILELDQNMTVTLTLPPLGFHDMLPLSGLYDDVRNLMGLTPTNDYWARLRSKVQVAWDERSSNAIAAVQNAITLQASHLWTSLQHRYTAELAKRSRDWEWSVMDNLLHIKARDLWLRRGAPILAANRPSGFLSKLTRFIRRNQDVEPIDGPHECDRIEARRSLEARVHAGEPFSVELLRCEFADTSLSCLLHDCSRWTKTSQDQQQSNHRILAL